MIKHTLEISQRPARLSLHNKQLILHLDESESRRFPCEDIGVLILQHPAISVSAAALDAVLQAGAAVVICGAKHLPTGLLLPTHTHTELVPRMMAQLDTDAPSRKRAWKAIVRAKIEAQAAEIGSPFREKLQLLARDVKSGDSQNAEAQAARIYWPARFPEQYKNGDKRNPESESIFNVSLNYGYSIIRATVARSLVAAGLQPALGVFHRRRDNPFCLADDVMEPLRPLVERTVADLLVKYPKETSLTPDIRKEILQILTYPASFNDHSGPLMATLPNYIASFYRLLTRETDHFEAPHY